VTARMRQAIVDLDRDAIDPGNAGGFVHNASALHTTPPAHQKQVKQHSDSYYKIGSKADIFTRQRQVYTARTDKPAVALAAFPLLAAFGSPLGVSFLLVRVAIPTGRARNF
jgi:hypothetical protein